MLMSGPDPFIGRDVLGGQFRILQKIGSGGMGSVYKALQPSMNRLVAVKILHPKLANRKDLVSRFRREASAMSHLAHPNTVKVFNYGELEDGSLYIAMEFLAGRSLHQTVRKQGPLPVQRALSILIQVCGALEEAHRKGIVHRDLKPENIFLCTDPSGQGDYAKVLDFGLAKVTEREMNPGSIVLTQEGMVFGTPEFMSPEQAQGKLLDPRSDIYSLAVILYEALTGKLPFHAKTPMEYIQHHVATRPIDLNKRVPGLVFPRQLEAVIAKCLQKKPDARYQTASEFADALKLVQAELTGGAGAAPAASTAQPSQDPATPAVAPMGAAPVMPAAAAGAYPMIAVQQHAVAGSDQGGNTTKVIVAVAMAGLLVGIALTVVVMLVLFL